MSGYSVREKRQRAGEEAVAGQEEYYKGLTPGWTVVRRGLPRHKRRQGNPSFKEEVRQHRQTMRIKPVS